MCERFAQVWDEDLGWYLARWVGPQPEGVHDVRRRDPARDARLAPNDPVGVLLERAGRPSLEWVRWGFPSGPGQAVANTPLAEAMRPGPWRPLMERRAAVPMTGFYEWGAQDGRPYFLHRSGGGPLMVAALCGLHGSGPGGPGFPCMSLLTGPAAPDVAHVQGLLPLVLEPDDVEAWLDPSRPAEDAARLVATPRAGTLAHSLVTRERGVVRTRAPRAGAVPEA